MKRSKQINFDHVYLLLQRLVTEDHDHLIGAVIKLAWCTSWKPDAHGILTLGKCKLASDLDRQLHGCDFVILLNRLAWNSPGFESRQEPLMFHELCHADVTIDEETGEPVYNEAGRKVWRIRKHDFEEFQSVVRKYGTWTGELQEFAATCIERGKRPLFKGQEPAKATAIPSIAPVAEMLQQRTEAATA